jgi:hypothetical protein
MSENPNGLKIHGLVRCDFCDEWFESENLLENTDKYYVCHDTECVWEFLEKLKSENYYKWLKFCENVIKGYFTEKERE